MSIKRSRDIYEGIENASDTTGYRRKLCDNWCAYQFKESAKMNTPTDLGSSVSDTKSQRAHKKLKTTRDNASPWENHQNNAPQNNDNFQEFDFIEPFSGPENRLNNNLHDDSFTLFDQNLVNRDKSNKHRDNDVQKNTRAPEYRPKDRHLPDLGAHDFGQLNHDDSPLNRHGNQKKVVYKPPDYKKRKISDAFDTYKKTDDVLPSTDRQQAKSQEFDLEFSPDPFPFDEKHRSKEKRQHSKSDADYRINKYNSKHSENSNAPAPPMDMTYRRLNERSYVEITPFTKEKNNKALDIRKYMAVEPKPKIPKASHHKHELQLYDGKTDEKRKYVMSRKSNEFQFISKPSAPFEVAKVLSDAVSSHPIVLNIKCNNIILKTDKIYKQNE